MGIDTDSVKRICTYLFNIYCHLFDLFFQLIDSSIKSHDSMYQINMIFILVHLAGFPKISQGIGYIFDVRSVTQIVCHGWNDIGKVLSLFGIDLK